MNELCNTYSIHQPANQAQRLTPSRILPLPGKKATEAENTFIAYQSKTSESYLSTNIPPEGAYPRSIGKAANHQKTAWVRCTAVCFADDKARQQIEAWSVCQSLVAFPDRLTKSKTTRQSTGRTPRERPGVHSTAPVLRSLMKFRLRDYGQDPITTAAEGRTYRKPTHRSDDGLMNLHAKRRLSACSTGNKPRALSRIGGNLTNPKPFSEDTTRTAIRHNFAAGNEPEHRLLWPAF